MHESNSLTDFARLGASIPAPRIAEYCDVLAALHDSINLAQTEARQRIRQQFRESLDTIEDDLLRLQLDGGAVHSVFAKSICYLLRRHGGLTTVQLHPLISSIHPDLCDDSIDRIIDGEHYGKKWKHAVRTAQQQLKKTGKIRYDDGIWQVSTGS